MPQAPSVWIFPVVLLEPDVVRAQIDPARLQALQSREPKLARPGAGLRMTWNCWCLNRRFGFSPKRPSAGRRDGWT